MSVMSENREEDGGQEKMEYKSEREVTQVSEEIDQATSEDRDQQINSTPQESQACNKMQLNDHYMSPEKRQYHSYTTPTPYLISKAETFVTRSLIDKYGPIVSPAISPTRSVEKNDAKSHKSRSPLNLLEMKTDRDYETATLICSIADSANDMQRNVRELASNSVDTLRVSRISNLLGFTSPAMPDYSSPTNGRNKPPAKREHARVNSNSVITHCDNAVAGKEHVNGTDGVVRNDLQPVAVNGHTPNDTDDSECDNDDSAMIIRPRDQAEHTGDNGDASGYACRLPCCTRIGFSAQQMASEGNTHAPIRVPARRPAQIAKDSQSDGGDQGKSFPRYRDSGKSAFSSVSPNRKRAEAEFPSPMPAIKVRVIKEPTKSTAVEEKFNGHIKQEPNENEATNGHHHHHNHEQPHYHHHHHHHQNHRDNPPPLYAEVKKENDIEPMHHPFSSSSNDRKNFEFSKENSYQPIALINGVLPKHLLADNSVFTQSFMKENNLMIAKTPSAHVSIDGQSQSQAVNFSSEFISSSCSMPAGLAFLKRDTNTNTITNGHGHTARLVQCSTVDSTATADPNAEGESRLLDLARVANEQLGEELAKQQPTKKGKPKSNDCLHLWEFLRDILNSDTMAPRAIEWTVRERGEFRLIKTGVVAQMWGMSKNRTSMTYEKMARAMRYYYKMKILEKVPHKRLHFRFGKEMLPKVLVSKE